jgi:hypothetical protein
MYTSSYFDGSFAYHSVRALIKLTRPRELSFPDLNGRGKSTPNGVFMLSTPRDDSILERLWPSGNKARQAIAPWNEYRRVCGAIRGIELQ